MHSSEVARVQREGTGGQIEIGPSNIDGKAAFRIRRRRFRSQSLRIGTMTIQRRRAFHLSGASWLLLCTMGSGAAAQDAARATTQLPEITVTAPSPIVRRSTPSRTPSRVARAVPAPNREPVPPTQPAPV